MKFKQIVLFGICAFRFCSWEVQALTPETVPIRYNINEMDNLPTGYEEIILMGDLMMGNGPRPIIAGANDNSIYIHFNQSFGNVNILIYNAMGGLIYNNVMDTSMQQTMIIPVSGTFSGTYSVVVNNANGYAEGDFERN